MGGKKQKPVEVTIKLRNPMVEKFTGFLLKSNCMYQLLTSGTAGAFLRSKHGHTGNLLNQNFIKK